jgi:hypothetical protein
LVLALPSVAWGQVSIRIDDGEGPPGDTVVLGARLSAAGFGIVATQNELHLAEGLSVVSCRANPAIDKEATLFVYLPRGCERGVDCSGVRVLVFSLANTTAIPNRSLLYSCTVSIDATASVGGALEMACSEPLASTANGQPLETACPDSVIAVIEPQPTPCIGDCDGDRQVEVSELLIGVNVLLERAPIATCRPLDRDLDSTVSVDELVAAINQALRGCLE